MDLNGISDRLRGLYASCFGEEVQNVEPLAQSGSNRRYFRLDGGAGTVIGVWNEDVKENEAFVGMAHHFRGKGIKVPEVYAFAEAHDCYLQQDLGDMTLYDAVSCGRTACTGPAGGCYSEEEANLLCRVVAALPKIQFEGADGLDFGLCHPIRETDARSVMFDLHYFKYCYLKGTGLNFNEMLLEDDFERLCADILREPSDCFMYRDFQARNVMLCGIAGDAEPYFIDFQGGRKGQFYYDIVSFVWQAKAAYPSELKERLIARYHEALQEYVNIDRAEFDARLRKFVLFRTLQVLGAYGFRGLIERKQHFIDSIPFALANLRELLAEPFGEYPYLDSLLRGLVQQDSSAPLTVTVTSFSYKKGIPADESSNGGGYVFDCRAIHNPGRYEPYRQLTGRDEAVIRFLEDDGEVFGFLEHVYALADKHVERYLSRGFTHLMLNFGCTGGQHRSVYCAEHTAAHLRERFGDAVNVVLKHREQ